MHGYFGEVAAAVRVIVPLWKPPKAPKAPTKQLTPTERNADYRARKTAEERDTSAKWLQPMPRRCRTALATAAPAGRPTGVRRP